AALGGHPDRSPADIEWIGAAIEHPAHPIERRIGIRPAHGLVERGDLVVKRLAALVEAAQGPRNRRLDERKVDRRRAALPDSGNEVFDEVDDAAAIAVRVRDQRVARSEDTPAE